MAVPASQLALVIKVTGLYVLAMSISALALLLCVKNRKFTELGYFFSSVPMISFVLYFLNGYLTSLYCPELDRYQEVVAQRFIFAVCPLVITALLPSSGTALIRSIVVYCVIATIVSVLTFFDGWSKGFADAAGNWSTLHRNLLSDFCNNAFLIGLVFIVSLKSKSKRLLCIVPLVAGFLGLFATQSRGGALSLIASCGVAMLLKRLSAKYIVLCIAVLVACIGVVAFLLPAEVIQERSNLAEGSAGARPVYWSLTWKYLWDSSFKPLGWGQRLWVGEKRVTNYCNLFLEDLVEGGITGFLCSAAFFGSVVWLAWKNSMQVPRRSSLSVVNLVGIGFLLIQVLHGCLDSFWIGAGAHTSAFIGAGFIVTVAMQLRKQQAQAKGEISKPAL